MHRLQYFAILFSFMLHITIHCTEIEIFLQQVTNFFLCPLTAVHLFSFKHFIKMGSEVPGVEHRDPQYFGYYAMLQHQVIYISLFEKSI